MKRISCVALLIVGLSGCAASTPESTAASSPTPTPSRSVLSRDGLPTSVADKREAIYVAAKAEDYDALAELLDPTSFTYSYGEGGDPIGAWKDHQEDGQSAVRDILPVLLEMPFGIHNGIHMWPRMSSYGPEDWTDEDKRLIKALYDDMDIQSFEDAGSYVGYRVGIKADGTWIYFVAGD